MERQGPGIRQVRRAQAIGGSRAQARARQQVAIVEAEIRRLSHKAGWPTRSPRRREREVIENPGG